MVILYLANSIPMTIILVDQEAEAAEERGWREQVGALRVRHQARVLLHGVHDQGGAEPRAAEPPGALLRQVGPQQVLHLVDREMQSSVVWVFQRVFACTPTLMVSVMILLANFTVFSTGENVAIATVTVTETPPAIARILSSHAVNPQPPSSPLSNPFHPNASSPSLLSPPGSGYGGKNTFPPAPTTQGFDGADSWRNGVNPNRR